MFEPKIGRASPKNGDKVKRHLIINTFIVIMRDNYVPTDVVTKIQLVNRKVLKLQINIFNLTVYYLTNTTQHR